MKLDRDCIALSTWITLFSLLLAVEASALTRDLKWTHPQPDRPMMVVVMADGLNIATVPVEDPDANGVFTTTVAVPYGADIQLVVQDADGEASNPSNPEVFGDRCSDFDSNGDGVIGGPDWGWVGSEIRAGTASTDDYRLFEAYFGSRC